MARLKNSYELKLIRQSGKIAAAALKKAINSIKVGVSELEIDKIAEREIYRLGGDLSYKSVPGYKYATCITVNDQVVHGIPTQRKFINEDIVSVDLAVEYKGWHTDCAWSVLVRGKGKGVRGKEEQETERFLKIGHEALKDGVAQAITGNRVGDISQAIQNKVESSGYNVVRSLVGHGVGKALHEEPEIPGYGKAGSGMILKSGMSLAIEVIYTMGHYDLILESDGWTYATEDKSLSGLFEATVIVGSKTEILTMWEGV